MTVEAYVHHEQRPYQEPDQQSGDYFVSAYDQSGKKHALLSGPYIDDHPAALADLERVMQLAINKDAFAVFYAFGTCRLPPGSGTVGVFQRRKLLALPEHHEPD